MKLQILPVLALSLTPLAVSSLAVPPTDFSFEGLAEFKSMINLRDHEMMLSDLSQMVQKRDMELSIESILNLVNRSGIIYDILDQIAYDPKRIEFVANITGRLVGDYNSSSFSSLLQEDAFNYTLIYEKVMDSGVVTSLLDGILLDESYRPTLVKLVSRILEGNENLILYVVKDVFKKSKRDNLEKRSTGSLETFLGNILSTIFSSKLVSGIADDTLVALNNTQFLTYNAKKLIANEAYQNMTAQLAIDLIRNGQIKLDSQALNVTSIASRILSRPDIVLKIASNLLSGNMDTSSMGKYAGAIRSIIQETEKNGVFEKLNNYVFSETHTVSKPLIPTGNIVVPRKTSTRLASSTRNSSSITKTSSRTQSESSLDSAAEVASILSLLGATTTRSEQSTTTEAAESSATSGFDLSKFLEQLSSEDVSSSRSTLTSTKAESSEATNNLIGLLSLLGNTNGNYNKRQAVTSNSTQSSTVLVSLKSSSNAANSHGLGTKLLIYTQAVIVGSLLCL